LNTESVMSRFRGLRQYQEYMHREMEREIREFYGGEYQRPILGDRSFVHWVREKLGSAKGSGLLLALDIGPSDEIRWRQWLDRCALNIRGHITT